MKPLELKDLIKARFTAQVKRALMVESSPGLGKTQIAAQAAHELEVDFKSIHAPLMQPEDYGLPVVTKDKTSVDFLVSMERFPLEGSKCGDEGILLIDEMSQADSSAQKILANLIQEREIHGKKLKPGWMIVATGNRQSDRAGANRILGHLSNRLTRVELEASLECWSKWALENNVKPEVVAFIRFRPELLTNYQPNQDINATPRAWVEGVSASLGVIPSKLEFPVFSGDVGEGPASELLAFLKIYRELPDPDLIIKDPKKVGVPRDPATLYAICGALVARVNTQNFGKCMTYIRRLPAEFSVLFVKDAMAKCPDVSGTKDFIDWASNEGADLLA